MSFTRLSSIYFIILSIVLLAHSCGPTETPYEVEINEWRAERLAELQQPYDWTSVVGLYELKNSLQYFGSGDNNEIILPPGSVSSFGSIAVEGDSVLMRAYSNLDIQINGKKTSTARLLHDRDNGGPTIAQYKSLQWHIIERQEKLFLRVKDSLSVYRKKLTEVPNYPTDPNYKVKAKFIKADTSDRVQYENIVGMNFNVAYQGTLEFELKGQTHRLAALNTSTNDSYFVIFGDQTNVDDTYGGGRYLYPHLADETGHTWLDFNRAINPPCVFTPFATCPLPSNQNQMATRIEAGEKYVKIY